MDHCPHAAGRRSRSFRKIPLAMCGLPGHELDRGTFHLARTEVLEGRKVDWSALESAMTAFLQRVVAFPVPKPPLRISKPLRRWIEPK